MGAFHSVWGWVAIALCGVSGLWGLVLAGLRRQPTRPYWVGVGLAMAAVVVQVVLGVLAFSVEKTRPGNQHLFYGVVVSFTLGFAYIYRPQLARRPALSYGLLMLFVMGLGIRGVMTFGHDF
jgi:hypothetical protein